MIFAINKPKGLTPLEALTKFQANLPILEQGRFTYAGRLDPLASGLLLILDSKDVEFKELYLNLSKTYIATCLFGVKTDTGDVIGLPIQSKFTEIPEMDLKINVNKLPGTHFLALPTFTSVPVDGTPMWKLAKEGNPKTVIREMEIFSTELLNFKSISSQDLLSQITSSLNLIKGDFRQEQIKTQWHELLKNQANYQIAKIEINCASGVYIRSIVPFLGELLNSSACLLDLSRTQIGPFKLSSSWTIEP
jgi:tRNA pseudouridine55 synthase